MRELDLFNSEEDIFLEEAENFIAELEKEILKLEEEERFFAENQGFNWAKEFPQCCDSEGNWQGFDLVIGNPPYIGLRTAQLNPNHVKYYKENYKLAVGQFDIYSLFIELAQKLLKSTGYHSFIVSKRMATNENMELVRRFITSEMFLYNYVDSGMPFESTNVESIIIGCSATKIKDTIEVSKIVNDEYLPKATFNLFDLNNLPFYIFPFSLQKNAIELIKKIEQISDIKLGTIVEILRGFEFGYNHKTINKENKGFKIIKGENIERYTINYTNFYVDADFKDKKTFKDKKIFLNIPKLVSKFVSNKLCFAYDNIGYCNTNVVYNIHLKDKDYNILFLLAMLNSKLINFWFFNVYANEDKIFPHIQKNQLASIPLIKLNKTQQKPFIKLVDKILKMKNEIQNAEIQNLEHQIDMLVYKLYNLTNEEIKIIENERT